MKNPKTCFAVAVGPGREATFRKLEKNIIDYAPRGVSLVSMFDDKAEGCGVIRARLLEMVRHKNDIVIQLDDDMEMPKGWLEKVWEAYYKYPKHNLFTTRIDEAGAVRMAGVDMLHIGDAIKMVHKNELRTGYSFAEFAPGGCMIFCRDALEHLSIGEIPICEEFMIYGEWLKYNLGKAVVIHDAVLVHNVKDNPRVKNWRTIDNIMDSAMAIYKKYGFTFVDEVRDVASHVANPTESQIRDVENRIKKLKDLQHATTAIQ